MIVLNLQFPIPVPTEEEVAESEASLSPSLQTLVESGFCTAEELTGFFRLMALYGSSMPFMLDSFLDSWRASKKESAQETAKESDLIQPPSGLILP